VLNIYMNNNANINIDDLNEIRNIIDLATTRGAFQASELSRVGNIYDRLTAFLEAIMAQAQAQTPQGE